MKVITEYNRRKVQAQQLVARAVRKGELKPVAELMCSDCPEPATCYDHRDYRKPLEVEPVCFGCNKARGVAIDYPLEQPPLQVVLHRCRKCKAEWRSRKPHPVQCPRCKRVDWNSPSNGATK